MLAEAQARGKGRRAARRPPAAAADAPARALERGTRTTAVRGRGRGRGAARGARQLSTCCCSSCSTCSAADTTRPPPIPPSLTAPQTPRTTAQGQLRAGGAHRRPRRRLYHRRRVPWRAARPDAALQARRAPLLPLHSLRRPLRRRPPALRRLLPLQQRQPAGCGGGGLSAAAHGGDRLCLRLHGASCVSFAAVVLSPPSRRPAAAVRTAPHRGASPPRASGCQCMLALSPCPAAYPRCRGPV